jgi:hypothetical protein
MEWGGLFFCSSLVTDTEKLFVFYDLVASCSTLDCSMRIHIQETSSGRQMASCVFLILVRLHRFAPIYPRPILLAQLFPSQVLELGRTRFVLYFWVNHEKDTLDTALHASP